MKSTLLILLATLCATIAFGQVLVRADKTMRLMQEPDRWSLQLIEIHEGDVLFLGSKAYTFREALFNNQPGFLHKNSLKNCTPIDSKITIHRNSFHVKNNRDSTVLLNLKYDGISPQVDIVNGGLLIYTGLFTSGITAILFLVDYPGPHKVFDPVRGIPTFSFGATSVYLLYHGFRKIHNGNKKLKMGFTSSGLGMTINLNK
jgi:hypothetical protein